MKRRTKYSANKEAKRRSREAIGTVPKTKVIPDKRRKKPKHPLYELDTDN